MKRKFVGATDFFYLLLGHWLIASFSWCVLYTHYGWRFCFVFCLPASEPLSPFWGHSPFVCWWEGRQGSGRLEETCVPRTLAARAKAHKWSYLNTEIPTWGLGVAGVPCKSPSSFGGDCSTPGSTAERAAQPGVRYLGLSNNWRLCNPHSPRCCQHLASLSFPQLPELVLSIFASVLWTLSSFQGKPQSWWMVLAV